MHRIDRGCLGSALHSGTSFQNYCSSNVVICIFFPFDTSFEFSVLHILEIIENMN